MRLLPPIILPKGKSIDLILKKCNKVKINVDYVSKVVSTEHAKFRLFAPLRNQLKRKLKKERGKKDKYVER